MKALFLTLGILSVMAVCEDVKAQSTEEIPSFIASIGQVANTSTICVLVTKEFGKRLYLSLRDEKHNLVYSGEMAKRSTQRRFDLNLTQLANGKYYIDLWDGKTPVVTKIIIKEQIILATPIVSTQITYQR
jgi:hypothetical protein